MKDYPFYTAYTQARELYGLILQDDEFENLGLIAWDKIGNKKVRLYKYQTEPMETETGEIYVDLPCNVDILEAVTANYEDYQKTSPTTSFNNNVNGSTEAYIESRTFNTSFDYVSGKFIKYHQEKNRLWLADKFNLVNIFYKGILTDNVGLPSLNVKEIDAIAVFCAYTDLFKKALVSRDQNTMQFAQLLKADWLKMCTQARVPDHFTQNEMDEILNVSTSWDRKRFGKSFKPIR